MRNLVSGGLIAAALGAAMTVTSAMSAPAQVMHPQSALATDGQSGFLTLVKGEHVVGGGGGGIRGGGPSGGMPLIKPSGPGPGPITHSAPITQSGPMTHSNVTPPPNMSHNMTMDRNRHHRRFVDRDFFFFNSFAFAPDYVYPNYYYDDYGYDDAVAYCLSRFRTYDLVTHTYLGLDGLRHPCP